MNVDRELMDLAIDFARLDAREDRLRTLLGRALVLAGDGPSELVDTLNELWELLCEP